MEDLLTYRWLARAIGNAPAIDRGSSLAALRWATCVLANFGVNRQKGEARQVFD
jgi:hypothetical protein